jgi:GTP cyclohydrolase II
MTTNPKKIKALEKMGLTINKRVPILSESNEHNKKYLSTKAQKLGHLM